MRATEKGLVTRRRSNLELKHTPGASSPNLVEAGDSSPLPFRSTASEHNTLPADRAMRDQARACARPPTMADTAMRDRVKACEQSLAMAETAIRGRVKACEQSLAMAETAIRDRVRAFVPLGRRGHRTRLKRKKRCLIGFS